jgi:hypothetical protein
MRALLTTGLLLGSLLLTTACGEDTDEPKPDDTGTATVDADGDGYDAEQDCDDGDEAVFPGADELCNGVDDDCDDEIDEDDAVDAPTWHSDDDGDGFGDPEASTTACEQPPGTTVPGEATDCDDGDDSIYPGAPEYCDGVDHDCDGVVNEDDAVDAETWYADADADGHGDPEATAVACEAPSGFIADDTDCDDGDDAVHPGADELCNGIDDDCDEAVDEDDAVDASTWYADGDSDGFGDPDSSAPACEQPSGFVADDNDCDDNDDDINPDATELCNGDDDDCDGTVDEADAADAATWYGDSDGDGYGDPRTTYRACDPGSGWLDDASDCDDSDAGINPGVDEACDGIDNDCDGLVDDADTGVTGTSTWYFDYDGDGYGGSIYDTEACDQPSSYAASSDDCDDGDATINPAGTELCNGDDDDCDGTVDEDDAADALTWYADADSDGYGDPGASTMSCEQPSGYLMNDSDCDDSEDSVYPGADELPDGEDNDCNGLVDDFPAEDCEDGIDNDFDGLTDCEDEDCIEVCFEDCGDGRDNDGDGAVDCDDDECFGVDGCGWPFDMELTTSFDGTSLFARGPLITTYYGDYALLYGNPDLELTGTPTGGSGRAFTCTGSSVWFSSYGYGLEYSGGSSAMDYIFTWYPSVANGGLQGWTGTCPIDELPTAYLGFLMGAPDRFYRMDDSGSWTAQYITTDFYYEDYLFYGTTAFYGAWMDDLVQQAPVTWTESISIP